MTVRDRANGVIELSGRCGAEDAEKLQRGLLAEPGSTVNWSSCEHLHASVLQVLLVAQPRIEGVPASPFLRAHIGPLLTLAAQ